MYSNEDPALSYFDPTFQLTLKIGGGGGDERRILLNILYVFARSLSRYTHS